MKIELGGGIYRRIDDQALTTEELRTACQLAYARLARQAEAIERLRTEISAALAKCEADSRVPEQFGA